MSCGSLQFQCARTSNEGVNKDFPTSTIGKRQGVQRDKKSQDAHSTIDDRIVKSIDDLHASSATEWKRSNLLNIEGQQMGIRYKRLQMIRERIAMERELMTVDKHLYNECPSLIESPNDAKKRLVMRQAKIEQLIAQADDNIEEHVTTQTFRNLNHSFDDEADIRS